MIPAVWELFYLLRYKQKLYSVAVKDMWNYQT